MRMLILVKHSLPDIREGVDAADWQLSAEGARRCGPLADALAAYLPVALYCSAEPKARETALLVGERLGLAPVSVAGLHEHDRRGAPLLGQAAFEEAMARFFARPAELVYGNEAAVPALRRFRAALEGILARETAGNVVVVSHGTVISLYVESLGGAGGFALWRRLQCPSCVALELPAMRLVCVVDRIG